MKQWLKKITGVLDLEVEAQRIAGRIEEEHVQLRNLEEERLRAEEATKAAALDEEIARMSPKERATKRQEPWINVLDVKVNRENIRNGFFELDWNDYFIKDLILNGYGTESDPEEEVVDRWFRDIVYQMLAQEGLDTSRGAGYISVVPLEKGKSQVS